MCRKRQVMRERSEAVDRKLDLVVGAGGGLGRMSGQQLMHGYTILNLGRLLPEHGDVAVKNEGIGILLDERATAAWRQGGEVWKAVSSRIVMASLKWMVKGQR